jgi:hypothetical protein
MNQQFLSSTTHTMRPALVDLRAIATSRPDVNKVMGYAWLVHDLVYGPRTYSLQTDH